MLFFLFHPIISLLELPDLLEEVGLHKVEEASLEPACISYSSDVVLLNGEDHDPVGIVSKEGLLRGVCHGLLAVCQS